MQFLKKQATLKIHRFLAFITCVATAMALCSCAADPLGNPQPSVTQPLSGPKIKLTSADKNTAATEFTSIRLDDADAVCRITQAGAYVISGELNGKIQIDAEDQVIHIILDGVSVSSPQGPALEILSAGKVILTLKEGTLNTFADSGHYPDNTESDACIYSECDLTINGGGSLNVHGYFKDAIHSKDVLKLLGGVFFVQSKRDGIRGNDGIVVSCESVSVESERHGLRSSKSGKEAKGNIELYDTECSIIAGGYGISCNMDLYVSDCALYVMGILENIHVNGTAYIAEGSLLNE